MSRREAGGQRRCPAAQHLIAGAVLAAVRPGHAPGAGREARPEPDATTGALRRRLDATGDDADMTSGDRAAQRREHERVATGLEADEPQYAAGTRTEPIVSVPRAMPHRPAATAAAEPPLEPPGVKPG